MKPKLAELLACPCCAGELQLMVDRAEGSEVLEGTLTCRGCGRPYPITGAIPRLLPQEMSAVQERTASAFGWQWKEFTEMHPGYEAQFLDWIHPIQPSFFRGKLILDAGCGIGRHAYMGAHYGARNIIAMDLSEAVDTAYANIGHMPNAHVVQADVYHPPFRRSHEEGPFDFVYSIGVLHHLPDPEAGFRSLIRLLRPGGTIFAWVYGHENNGVVHYFIDPLRTRVTSRLAPRTLTRIAWPMAVALQGIVKGIYRPLKGTPLFHLLPSHEYLASLADFTFRQNYNIVFDHLVAPVAFYIRRDEFLRWFLDAGLEHVDLSWRNKNSWRGRGQVPAVPEAVPPSAQFG